MSLLDLEDVGPVIAREALRAMPNHTYFVMKRRGTVHLCWLYGNIPSDQSIKFQRMTDWKIMRLERMHDARFHLLVPGRGRILTCVYCGHQYPQDAPAHGTQVLTEHIRICPKHPLRQAQCDLALVRGALAGLVGEHDPVKLGAMEVAVRALPAPDQDKAAMLQAIHALLNSQALPPQAAILKLARWAARQIMAERPRNESRLADCVEAGLVTRVQHPTPDLVGSYDDGVRHHETPFLTETA